MIKTFKKADARSLSAIAEEKAIRKTSEVVIFFPNGSQTDHLIVQRLAALGVFCLPADPNSANAVDVKAVDPIGIVLSGGPASVHAKPPHFDNAIFDLGIPTLGICLGFQMWSAHVGAKVMPAPKREFGRHRLNIICQDRLFSNCPDSLMVLQNHSDFIGEHPDIKVLARTDNAPVSAGRCGHLTGVQFHPEVSHTDFGTQILENFIFKECQAKDRYPVKDVAYQKIKQIRAKVWDKKVLIMLSGGSDSAVCCGLLKHAFDRRPGKVRAIYIKGLDRRDDEMHVRRLAQKEWAWLDFEVADATDMFLRALAGVTESDGKREAVRNVYRYIAEREAAEWGDGEEVLVCQGTLYTDISESGAGYDSGAEKAKIKQHHNIRLRLSYEELTPLADCVKDNARNIGREIGVDEHLLTRHPFPGVGLAIRIDGEVTRQKIRITQDADEIYVSELRASGLYEEVWQAGADLTSSRVTHTKGEEQGLGREILLWAQDSVNGFTSLPTRLPWDFLMHVSQRLTNEIQEVSSVAYKVSGKPPATIERG
jgi:GMP synthase (glutamine-hydrolysing)